MNSRFKTHRLVESALMIALAAVLSFVILFRLPFGGSITLCAMLPLVLISYRYGVRWGLVCGLVFSLIQSLQGVAEGTFTAAALGVENGVYQGGFFVGSQALAVAGILLLDYVLAYTVVGFAGALRSRFPGKPVAGILCGTLFAGALRYLCHVLSGAIFFGIWGEWFFSNFSWGAGIVAAFPGKSLYFVYSLIYNATFLVPEILLTAVAAALAVKAVPKLAAAQTPERANLG